jgi:hypothetical protein
VDQRDVERDTAKPNTRFLRGPRVGDPAEQALVVLVTGVESAHRGGDDIGNLVQRSSLGALIRRRHCGHPVRVNERLGAVQYVEGAHQTIEGLTIG